LCGLLYPERSPNPETLNPKSGGAARRKVKKANCRFVYVYDSDAVLHVMVITLPCLFLRLAPGIFHRTQPVPHSYEVIFVPLLTKHSSPYL
jgi:hypothetical protein